jgi:DNA invertase Pin-like site-specific DNA recombinase
MFRDAVISILAVIAKQERLRIAERVRAALNRAKERGTKSGRPVGRRGVIFDRGKVIELRSANKSWREFAHACGVGITTVRRVCRMTLEDSAMPKSGNQF